VKAVKRPRFLLDLAEELTWLNEKAGAEVAQRWYHALVATLRFIEKNPLIGRERRDLFPVGIRSWRLRGFPRWLIFYAITPKGHIIFYRVRSGTMDLPAMKMES
jgi:plasmid stabilization system protein ParE